VSNDAQARKWEEWIVGAAMSGGSAADFLVQQFDPAWLTLHQARAVMSVICEAVNGTASDIPLGTIPSPQAILHILTQRNGIQNEPAAQQQLAAYIERLSGAQFEASSFWAGSDFLRKQYAINVIRKKCDEAITAIGNNDAASAYTALYGESVEDPSLPRSMTSAVADADYAEDLPDRIRRLHERRQNPDKLHRAIKTYIQPIDDLILEGGFMPGELLAIAAGAKRGKSVGMGQIAIQNALNGIPVAFFTFEMQLEETLHRFDSYMTGIGSNRFRSAKLDDDQLNGWYSAGQALNPGRLMVSSIPSGCTTDMVEARLFQWRNKTGFWPRLVVVDYAGIMVPLHGEHDSSTDQSSITQVLVDLKRFAMKLQMPTLTAVQLKPEATQKTVLSVTDIAFAKAGITMTVDWLIGLIMTDAMKPINHMEVATIVSRHGTGDKRVTVRPNLALMRIHDEGTN
jgi:hypothetical protein